MGNTISNSDAPIAADIPSSMSDKRTEMVEEGVSTTFEFMDVKPDPNFKVLREGEEGYGRRYTHLSECIQKNPKMFKKGDELHMASDREDTFAASFGHGLMGTILTAYSQHIPLVLRPDDVWISIVTAFSKYVVDHSEEMRDCFVSHQGRKELCVKVQSPLFKMTTEKHWAGFVGEMEKEIAKNVTSDVIDWLVPNFTTTTVRDRAVAQVVLMGALKEYFAYKFMLCCGLSKVTLEGSLEDWQQLVKRAEHLRSFKQETLNNWADLLIPVLEELVQAYTGEVDSDFWQRICTHETRGSGGQKTFRGWFLVFAPFNEKGKYLLRPKAQVDEDHIYGEVNDDDIPACYIDVPVTIEDHNEACGPEYSRPDGKKYETTFYAGMMMTCYDPETNSLQPSVDWAIVVNKEITLEDMHQELEESVSKGYQQPKEEDLAKMRTLVPFAYHAAKAFNFPQDSLLELAKAVHHYFCCWSRDRTPASKLDGMDLFKGFLEFISAKDFEGRCFRKYVVVDQIDNVITSYNNQD